MTQRKNKNLWSRVSFIFCYLSSSNRIFRLNWQKGIWGITEPCSEYFVKQMLKYWSFLWLWLLKMLVGVGISFGKIYCNGNITMKKSHESLWVFFHKTINTPGSPDAWAKEISYPYSRYSANKIYSALCRIAQSDTYERISQRIRNHMRK
jgi:hypothetical protein